LIPHKAESHFTNFLRKYSGVLTPGNLMSFFIGYLQEYFPVHSYALIHHEYSPWPYKIITPGDLAEKAVSLLSMHPGKIGPLLQHDSFIQIQDLHFYTMTDHRQIINWIIACSFTREKERSLLITFCRYIQDLAVCLSQNSTRVTEKIQAKHIEYISNFSHDFNSLIAVVSALNLENDPLHKKLHYGKKLSRELLFYLRELELSRTRVKVNELIEAILKNYSADCEIRSTIKPGNDFLKLSVDVELIDKAIQAVLENAVYGAQLVNGKVIIESAIIKNISVFFNHDWIKIDILNDGPAIPPEFLDHLKEPFFTTLKDQGKTGMGLALAEKIIQAHSGCMTISSLHPSGVRISIYLPRDEEYV